jgi:tight adherence protein C
MIWTTIAVVFGATVLIILAAVYAFSTENLGAGTRLARLWRPPVTEAESGFGEKQKQNVAQVLSGVGKLLPQSPKEVSRTQVLMIRAGYRRPEAVLAMRGVSLLLPFLFVAIVYFTGFYRENPVLILLVAAVLGYLLPGMWLLSRVRSRQARIRLSLPDCLDLLVVCVEAGLALDQAMLRVSQELQIAHPALCEELELLNTEIRVGKTRVEALRSMAQRTGEEDIKELVAMLIQTDRFGTSIAQSLRIYADDLRIKRRQRAEERVAKMNVKMIPALVFFIFPAMFVAILGPGIISLIHEAPIFLGK